MDDRSESDRSVADLLRLAVVLVSVGGLAAFPVVRLFQETAYPVRTPWWSFGALMIGACTLVWGVLALRTDRWDPVTPRRALWMPVVATVAAALAFAVTVGGPPGFGPHPDPPVRALLNVFRTVTGWFVAATTFAVFGSAVRRRSRTWLVGGACLSIAAALLAQTPSASGEPMFVASLGVVPAAIGYVTTPGGER